MQRLPFNHLIGMIEGDFNKERQFIGRSTKGALLFSIFYYIITHANDYMTFEEGEYV